MIFGDIMYESNRDFPERVCAAEGLDCRRAALGRTDRRRSIANSSTPVPTPASSRCVTASSIRPGSAASSRSICSTDITAAGVDPCGEHGEYHTVVVDAPLFSRPIDFVSLGHVCRRRVLGQSIWRWTDPRLRRGAACCLASESVGTGYSPGGRRGRSFALDDVERDGRARLARPDCSARTAAARRRC